MSRLALVLLLLLVSAVPAAAGINLVNSGINTGTGVSASLTVSGLSTGDYNTVVVVIALRTPGALLNNNPPVADSGGSSYFPQADVTANSTSSRVVIYSTAPGASKNSTSVTVNLSCCTTSDMVVAVASYSGVVSLGQTATLPTSSSTPATLSLTIRDANNWVVAGFAGAGTSNPSTAATGNMRQNAVANGTIGGFLTDNWNATANTSVANAVNLPGPEWTAIALLELRTAPAPSFLVSTNTTATNGSIGGTSGTGCSMTVPGGRIGDTIVVVVATNPATSVASVSDNATPTSSTYTFRQAVNSPGSNTRVEIWTATLASNFIWSTFATVQLSATGAHRACAAAVYAGVTGGIGTTSTASGTTANPSVPLPMGAANNVVVAGFATQGTTLATSLTGNLRRTVASSGGSSSNNAAATLTDNTATSPISVTNAVTLAAGQWAAVAVELKTKTCGTVTDPTYVAANAQIATGQTNVYWSSPTYPNVIVVRKPGKFTGEVPNNYQNYALTATGGSLGTAAVSYLGSASSFQETLGAGNYYYKVFAYDTSTGPTCYSTGTVVNPTDGASADTALAAPHAWSYAIGGGSTLAASIAGNGTLYTSSNAGRIISLNTADGTQSWPAGPTATNANTTVQSWLSWIPLSGSANNAVIGGDLGTGGANSATVYFVDVSSGAKTWTKSSLTGNGADAIVAAVSAQLWAYADAAFQTTLQSNYSYSGDVVYVATRNSSRTGNSLYALKATDGSVLWNFNASTTYTVDQIFGQPAVDYYRDRVYVASKAGVSNNQNNLWIIDSRTGAVIQQMALGTGHLQTSLSLGYDGNTLYAADVNGNLYAVTLPPPPYTALATLKWSAPAALGSAIKDTAFVWEDYTTTGRLYFSTQDGNVWCWKDPGAGATPNVTTPCSGWSVAKTPVGTAVKQPGTPLLLNYLFVGGWNSTLSLWQIYQLNPGTGAIVTQVTVGDGTKQLGDLSTETGNEIFVGTSDGKIYKYNLTGGSL